MEYLCGCGNQPMLPLTEKIWFFRSKQCLNSMLFTKAKTTQALPQRNLKVRCSKSVLMKTITGTSANNTLFKQRKYVFKIQTNHFVDLNNKFISPCTTNKFIWNKQILFHSKYLFSLYMSIAIVHVRFEITERCYLYMQITF